MLCVSCGCENREDARLCGRCGAPLAAEFLRPGCGHSNPHGPEFCDACGQRLVEPSKPVSVPDPLSYTLRHLADKILAARPSIEGERRTVTVLFADAAGFTPISKRLDQEQVYSLVQGCLARIMDAVHHYEGTITHFIGAGVMVLFGTPIAHEDSARRAVTAVLRCWLSGPVPPASSSSSGRWPQPLPFRGIDLCHLPPVVSI